MTLLKTSFYSVVAAGLLATSAMAQATTESSVLGESGDDVYSLRVQGDNGVLYNCKPGLVETEDGSPARACIRADEGGDVFAQGDGIAQAAPAVGVVLVAAAVASGGDDNGTTATTTTVGDN